MKIFLSIIFAVFSMSAYADENPLWITAGGFSHHFARDKGYNEVNTGIGIEYRIAEDKSFTVGQYRNSVRGTTHYVGMLYQPFAIGNVKLGVSIGVMDGYPQMNKGGTFLAAIPMATWEGEHVGVNVGVIPSMPRVDGALVMQFKFRF